MAFLIIFFLSTFGILNVIIVLSVSFMLITYKKIQEKSSIFYVEVNFSCTPRAILIPDAESMAALRAPRHRTDAIYLQRFPGQGFNFFSVIKDG